MEETDPGSGVDPIKALRGCAEGLNLGEKRKRSGKEDRSVLDTSAFFSLLEDENNEDGADIVQSMPEKAEAAI